MLILLSLARTTFLNTPEIIYAVIIAVISITLGTFISSHVEQKSRYGHDIYERCLGLRTYIAEKGGKDDTRDVYGALLPYAVALGLAEEWVESHRSLMYEDPQWYERKTGTERRNCSCLVHHLLRHVQRIQRRALALRLIIFLLIIILIIIILFIFFQRICRRWILRRRWRQLVKRYIMRKILSEPLYCVKYNAMEKEA